MKLPADSVRIVLLDPTHDRSGFACGVEGLDRYIREQARQDSSRDIARVFVATAEEESTRIFGYYTLSAAMIGPRHLPPDVARRMPRHPVPAALVGRLAVDQRQAGRGLGTILLADAVLRTDTAARSLGIAVIVVDPLGEDARKFYRGFGFRDAVGSDQMFLVRKVARSP